MPSKLFQLFAFLKCIAQLFAKGIVAVAAGVEGDGVELIQVDLAVGENEIGRAHV